MAACLRADRDLEDRKVGAERARDQERHMDELQALRNELLVDKAAKLAASAQRHRHRIINDILTLKCPHCSVAVFNFTACFAVQHTADDDDFAGPRQGCSRHFCGWCMAPFEGSRACHDHVKVCVEAPARHRGSWNGTIAEFNEVQSRRRRGAVLQYLRDCVPGEEERAVVREAIAGELRDLHIQL